MIPGLILLQASPAPGGNAVLNFVPILLIFAIFYFLLLRPMQRQRKDQQKMLANLQNGDVVLTNGGIIGTIIWLNEESVILRVRPDNLKLQITRSSVAGLAPENLK